MQFAMIRCNGVPTHVAAEGRWVEEGISQSGKKDVVIFIPGNPGIPKFYDEFVKHLKLRLPTEVPVWVLGQAGHVEPPSNLTMTMPSNDTWDEHYSLMAQLEHKKEFIRKYVPEDAKIHLIGHSVGCWMILRLLRDDEIAKRIVKCYLLFPAIEHMAKTPSGHNFIKYARAQSLIVFFCWLFCFLPQFLQLLLLRILTPHVRGKYRESLREHLNPYSLNRIFRMANEEMIIVKDRDDDIISKYGDKLWFYYGSHDGWAPVEYYNHLKSAHPSVNAILCKHGYEHIFMLESDKEVGEMIGDIVYENIS